MSSPPKESRFSKARFMKLNKDQQDNDREKQQIPQKAEDVVMNQRANNIAQFKANRQRRNPNQSITPEMLEAILAQRVKIYITRGFTTNCSLGCGIEQHSEHFGLVTN